MSSASSSSRLVIDGHRWTGRHTGVGRYLDLLLDEWTRTGLPFADSALIVNRPRPQPAVPGMRLRVVGQGWPGLAWEVFGLGRILRRDDVLLAPANLIPPTWRGQTVLVIHDVIHAAMPGALRRSTRWRFAWRYRLAARRATRIITPSYATASDVQKFYDIPSDRIAVIPPGIAPAFGPPRPDDEPILDRLGLRRHSYVLGLGKPSPRRHFPAWVEAISRLRARGHDLRLVHAGPEAPIGAQALGYCDDRTVAALLGGAVALAYTSDYEGFGLPVVEAMACGCPVVTRGIGALAEAAGEAALFVPDTDPDTLAAAVLRLHDECDLRERLIARGFHQASQFTAGRFARAVAAALPIGDGVVSHPA